MASDHVAVGANAVMPDLVEVLVRGEREELGELVVEDKLVEDFDSVAEARLAGAAERGKLVVAQRSRRALR